MINITINMAERTHMSLFQFKCTHKCVHTFSLSSLVKRCTLKMVFITGLFLVTSVPVCIEYLSAALVILLLLHQNPN